MSGTISVAIVGLGFGAEWVPCYLGHPNVSQVGVCDTDPDLLGRVADKYSVERRFASLAEVLESDEFDAVHLLTPIPDHARQSIDVLQSGRHCGCAIPMAMTLGEIDAVMDAAAQSGKTYMLMETENYSRTYLYAKQLFDSGEMGTLQFASGVHYQNMEGWPEYWIGLPPLLYSSHGLGPILEIAQHPIESVTAAGSGTLPDADAARYGNPFPVEAALFHLQDSDLILQMTCCLYKMVRIWAVDRFSIFGDLLGFESAQVPGGRPILHRTEVGPMPPGQRGRGVTTEEVDVPPLSDLVAPEIRGYVAASSVTRGIPLVHEFVRSIIEDRGPTLGPGFAANVTAAGICAHASALASGAPVEVPQW